MPDSLRSGDHGLRRSLRLGAQAHGVLAGVADGSRMVHLKGSAERRCFLCCTALLNADGERPMSEADRKSILAEVDRMSERAARPAFASKRQTGDTIDEAASPSLDSSA